MDPTATATGWARPYTSVQWAWVRALGVEPSAKWAGQPDRARSRHPRRRDMDRARRQRHGVRGL